jgi:hypothetical protein
MTSALFFISMRRRSSSDGWFISLSFGDAYNTAADWVISQKQAEMPPRLSLSRNMYTSTFQRDSASVRPSSPPSFLIALGVIVVLMISAKSRRIFTRGEGVMVLRSRVHKMYHNIVNN